MDEEIFRAARYKYICGDCAGSANEYKRQVSEIYEELYTCWRIRIRQKKLTEEAFEFEQQAGAYLWRLAEEVITGTWRPKGYKEFLVQNPERLISAPEYDDRIVEYWLTEKYIKPYIEPRLIDLNMACRDGKGQHRAVRYLREALEDAYKKHGNRFWYFKGDVKGYYDNISQDRVKEIYSGLEDLPYRLFVNILDSFEVEGCYARENDRRKNPGSGKRFGVPKGNLPSQWIGISYLDGLDHIISGLPYVLFYERFMDDFIAVFPEKRHGREIRRITERYLSENEMGVMLHPQKTQIAPITTAFNFCGWQFKLIEQENGDWKIRLHVREDRKKLKEVQIREMQRKYARGEMSWEDVSESLTATFAYYKQGDTKKLIKYLTNKYHFRRTDEDAHES